LFSGGNLRKVLSKFYDIMQGHVTPLPDDREEYRRRCVLLCAELGMTLYTADEARLRHVCKVNGFVPQKAIEFEPNFSSALCWHLLNKKGLNRFEAENRSISCWAVAQVGSMESHGVCSRFLKCPTVLLCPLSNSSG
jgi:hypothetical protein